MQFFKFSTADAFTFINKGEIMASPNRFEISEQTHSANFAMYNFHSHSWYEIFYLQSGQCTFYIQDKTYLMNEGDIAVIPPDIPHKTAYLAEVNKRLCIEFSANYIQPVISMFGNETLDSRLFTVLHNSAENTAFLDSLILNMINEHKQRDYISPAFLNVYFQEFILRLMRGSIPLDGRTIDFNNSSNTMQLAVDYINENFQNRLTLSDIAECFHLNPSYFSKRFKTVIGTGFKEYINNLRITKSEKMLLETNKNITEIAFECGFENSNYYGDAFKQKNGVSPTEYRKLKGNIK